MFSRSKRLSGLFAAPGNAGTEQIATNLPEVDPLDSESVVDACRANSIDVVLVGPEAPLAAGLADDLASREIGVIGPPKAAARLEASKTFAKEFMERHAIPTARSRRYGSSRDLEKAIEGSQGRTVLKQDGLAAGKGVFASDDPQELYTFGKEALEQGSVLMEEFLEGWEVSIFVLMDGQDYLMLPPCADFKKAGEGETGPNTGGMGSICPVPWVESQTLNTIETRIILPTLRGMREEGLSYRGVLYFGLMITDEGPKVLEYNVRFGDPETQALLPVIASDFCNVAEAILDGKLLRLPLRLNDVAAAAIVIAAAGYPAAYQTGIPVTELPSEGAPDALVFHAGTTRDEQGLLRTGGGRCFTVVGIGSDMLGATQKAYEVVPHVRFEGAWHRADIGQKLFME
jgi:phosphoribosylamine--glycine ligase